MKRREVNSTSELKHPNVFGIEEIFEPKHTKVFGIEEVLKTDNTENFSDNTKVDDSENSEKKLKDISNTDKETVNNSLH